MSIMKYIEPEDMRDINIELTSLHGIIDRIKAETANRQDVSVLLCTSICKAKVLTEHINAEWTGAFHRYLQDNRIELGYIICITPADDADISASKKLKMPV